MCSDVDFVCCCDQKMTRRADFKKLPTTAAGITDASSKERQRLLRKYRPSSAATSTGSISVSCKLSKYKEKANLSLCLIEYYAMKTYGGLEV